MPSTNAFIDPSALSQFDSPPSTPAASDYNDVGPSRKRQRTETSSEERKEARAHRNRIAAQNSRDRRKAQFSYLERRVAELEEENRQLRAGMSMPVPVPVTIAPPAAVAPVVPSRAEEQERERQRKENEELKERIKTLERGWDAVVKALAAQGLPTGLVPTSEQPKPSSPSPTLAPSSTKKSPSPTITSTPAPTPTNTFSTVFPISPAPSTSSLDFDLDLSPAPSGTPPTIFPAPITASTAPIFALPTPPASLSEQAAFEPTRHSAAGGPATTQPSVFGSSGAGQGAVVASGNSNTSSAVDDATMEDLFREILVPSPTIANAGLPEEQVGGAAAQEMRGLGGVGTGAFEGKEGIQTKEMGLELKEGVMKVEDGTTAAVASETNTSFELSGLGLDFDMSLAGASVDWTSEIEMQRIFDVMLEGVSSGAMNAGGNTDLTGDNTMGFDMGWELAQGVGVF